MGRKRLKSLRSDILLDRKVVASGTQILPHRHHPHSPLIYVLHHCSDFLNLLTQADHQSGLADYPSLACRPPEHTQGPLVIRLRPYCSIQTRNCLHIVVEYVRFSVQSGWPRMMHAAETTVPGALITHYQECRRTSLEALALVGTERAFADGMQVLGLSLIHISEPTRRTPI